MNGEGEPIVTPAPIGQTVGDILRLLMPEGTNSNRVNPDWSAPPDLPSVFGAAAYLIKISGISIYIDPHAMHSGESTEDQRTEFFSPNRKFYEKLEKTCRKIRKRLKKIRDCNNRIEALIPDEKQTQKMSQQEYDERWNEIEKIKADLGSVFFDAKQLVYEYIEPLWRDLWKHEDDWINMLALNADTICALKKLDWWKPCLKLVIAADTLCEGVGFPFDMERGESNLPSLEAYEFILFREYAAVKGDNEIQTTPTLAMALSTDVAIVLPKSVTPSVGCTVRSLSHNLSLLPPMGQTGAQWVYAPHSIEHDRLPLNILVIPIPYFVHANVFSERESCQEHGWGFFSVTASWLNDVSEKDFIKFVRELCEVAASKSGKVDAIVFPELAINYRLFRALEKEIASATKQSVFHEMEYIVAGLCDYKKAEGNFVGCALFSGKSERRQSLSLVRAKHHRWKIDGEQIQSYRLSHALNETLAWWEWLPPRAREIHFFRFRNSSSFTALICEDLARIDPCQEVLRSVGPDLIISILMDTVQIGNRWPSRYATVLAEDPGSSVLTITSKALIERSNVRRVNQGLAAEKTLSTSIGLWKDASAASGVPINLPIDCSAVLLTLANKQMNMRTLDGRSPRLKPKWSWRLTDQRPIKLSPERRRTHPDFGWCEDPLHHDDI